MEPARDAPWAEHEKVYLLAEIIKAAPIPSHVLYGLIRDSNIQPKWNDIALPHAYSTPDYRRAPQLPTPIVYSGPEIPKKRTHQPETQTPIGRLLQPRPPHTFPQEFVSGPTYHQMTPAGEPANKKKRGRPTRAEAQARADAAAARGEVYPPPRTKRASVTAPEPHLGEARPLGGTPPGTLAGPPGASTTPQQPPTERAAESSSGKKKRSKPTPLELEKSQREPSETESPSAFGSALGDPRSSRAYSTFTPISAPLPSATEPRDRDLRMEGVEESQPRTTTPHSFKDTVGI
ncbi:uncharacterized protein BDR25DRAFT_313930 [Lindgomyces ingoldianus]|uniref:Uncharacterized protein n=1 Tax=Lindgomyces ingoldianus TaxID=673940 RepID=A0ACB6QWA9_9PLEO|nr:uncharacterized protein BDR25DRAFT_313930 [Lindgomyces ingoldianus]KAF2471334.1 hypothetical protein BDR25DRAFT_313930 [Lindgomyces ingoldianus]